MLITNVNIDRTYQNTSLVKADITLDAGELIGQHLFKIAVSYNAISDFRYIGEVDGSTLQQSNPQISFEDTHRKYNFNRDCLL